MLTEAQQRTLLDLAYQSLRACVSGDPPPSPDIDDPVLQDGRGAFVTLTRDGALRGCIGLLEPDQPLLQAVIEMARAAALEDLRFPRVEPSELDSIHIELSVLGPLEQVSDVTEIEIGRHGLVIREGSRSGLLLPQVAAERNWTRLQFLQQTCIKAGLPPDEWEKGAEMSVFTAQVFGDRYEV